MLRWAIAAGISLVALFAMLIVGMFSAVLGTPSQAAGYEPSGTARGDIPPAYYKLCVSAAEQEGLDWAILCAITKIESDHGRLDAPGVRTGANSAGAMGPCQFLRGTWDMYGKGDVFDARACIPAAARYLKASGAPADWHKALFSYNHSEAYVADVLAQAAKYRGGIEGGRRVSSESVDAVLSNPRITLTPLQRDDLKSGRIDGRIVSLLGWMGRNHTITVTSLRSDHSFYTDGGRPSNHGAGRAVDVAVVDGQPCRGTLAEPCGQLALELAAVEGELRSTELIYGVDVDGSYDPRAFAQADHRDHVHCGFHG